MLIDFHCRLLLSDSVTSDKKKKNQNKQFIQLLGNILFGVTYGSIQDPVLFVFVSVLFLVIHNVDFARYVNDKTIYWGSESIDIKESFSVLSENVETQVEVGVSLLKNDTSIKNNNNKLNWKYLWERK